MSGGVRGIHILDPTITYTALAVLFNRQGCFPRPLPVLWIMCGPTNPKVHHGVKSLYEKRRKGALPTSTCRSNSQSSQVGADIGRPCRQEESHCCRIELLLAPARRVALDSSHGMYA